MVTREHLASMLTNSTYTSIISLPSLGTVMFIGGWNGIQMCAGDIGNACLEAYTTEKVAIVTGREFGDNASRLF